MKNILIPIDFTKVSFNAIKYALKAFKSAHITLLNVTPPSLNTTEIKYSLLNRVRTEENILLDEVRRLIKLELDLDEIPKNFTIEIKKGEVIKQIEKYTVEYDIDTIIMGTRDKYDLYDKIIGTTSLAVIKKLKVPVYLIPKNIEYRPFKRVIVASDHHILSSSLGKKIKKWNASYNAYIRFFHIKDSENDFIKETDRLIQDLFDDSDPTFIFDLQQKEGTNIGPMIINEAKEFKADLIISMPEKQNFINALFIKSVTKELIQNSTIPLLFIHPNNIQL